MSRSKPAKSAARSRTPFVTPLLAAVAAAIAAWLHRGALATFFTTDDLILFERARGIAEYPATLWRVIPGRLWFQGLIPFFSTNPGPWHAASLFLHAAATALVVAWARRMGASRAAAFLAALLFGTAARARTAVWPVSGAGELLATLLLLVTLLALTDEGRDERRARLSKIVAGLAQGIAMFCKETVALAPLVAWLAPPPGAARRVPWVPLALGAAMWAYVAITRGSTGSLSGDAYALGVGPHVLNHLLTYVIWSSDFLHLFGAVAPPLTGAQSALAAALLVSLAFAAWKSGSRAAQAGLWLWLLLLLPVLPLRNAVYDHYLYAPRLGWALAVAALLDRAVRGAAVGAAAPAWRATAARSVAAVVALLHVVTALFFLAAAEGSRIESVGLPRDTFLRKIEVARNAAVSLEGALRPEDRSVVIYEAAEGGQVLSVREGDVVSGEAGGPSVRQRLLGSVLDQGRGLRALFPRLESVRIGTSVEPADRDGALFVANSDGRLIPCGRGPEGHLEVARLWESVGLAASAKLHLAQASALHPGLESLALEGESAP
ncbi:MAG: hypothetical protein IT348_12600 [Candidatus Eisenbacteria bacterium]|nr:hypothetical protein [Candidatus Eisenbacteria bacterium]